MKFNYKLNSMIPVFCAGVIILVTMVGGCGSQSGFYETEGTDDVMVAKTSGPRIKAPEFEITDLDGKKINSDDLKGKVVFLDFWATWCVPCLISSPQVEKLHEEYKNEDFEVISVSLDQSERPVKEFIESRNIKSRNAMAGGTGIDVHYRVSGIPAFILIDQEGYIAGHWTGFNNSLPPQWRKLINQLLKLT